MKSDFSDRFNTPIPERLRPLFLDWVKKEDIKRAKQGRGSVLKDKYDYDIQGFWLATLKGDNVFDEASGHGSDRFKKPNHPTFSDESQYHGVSGYKGGTWKGDSFSPSKDNLKLFGSKRLKEYMNKYEPGVRLEPVGLFNER